MITESSNATQNKDIKEPIEEARWSNTVIKARHAVSSSHDPDEESTGNVFCVPGSVARSSETEYKPSRNTKNVSSTL